MNRPAEERLLIDEVPAAGLASVCLAFPGPETTESPGRFGWCGLLFEILRAGGGRVPEDEVLDRFDGWGGGLRTAVTHSMAALRYDCLPDRLPESLDLLFRIVGPGTVPAELLERETAARTAVLEEERDDPASDGLLRVRERCFGETPLAFSPLGRERDLRGADAAGIHAFADAVLRPSSAVLAISGSVRLEEIRERATGFLGGGGPGEDRDQRKKCGFAGEPFRDAVRHQRRQTVVVQAFPAAGAASDGFRVQSLLAGCLNGLAGPLFSEIRERHGLAYYSSVRLALGRFDGLLAFVSGCEEKRAGFLVEEIGRILRRFGTEGPAPAEFEAAVEQARAGLRFGRQRTDWRAVRMASRALLGLEADTGGSDEVFLAGAEASALRDWCAARLDPENGSELRMVPSPAVPS